ncbi:MAG: hypothetical protein IOD12_14015 [Silvanigrellales bacterium]|nr:hypothetical protein [Silvanigrellales bacterium]
MRLAFFVAVLSLASCSPPSVSDTDETKAPGQPISADPGADVGAASTAAQSLASAFRQSVGLAEVRDAAGKTKVACSALALGTDLALTSSLCAVDCVRTRFRFLSSATAAASTRQAPARVSHCSSVEVQDTQEGQGFVLMRLTLVDETDGFPASKIVLDESKPTRTQASVVLVTASLVKGEIVVGVSPACALRYAPSPKTFSTHNCTAAGTAAGVGASAPGGLLVDLVTKDALGIFDRTLSGASLVTTSAAILSK